MAFGSSTTPVLQPPHGTSAPLHQSYQELKTSLHRDLLSKIDLEKLTTLQDVRARTHVQNVIYELISVTNVPLNGADKERVCREVLQEVFGLGPLEPLLQDASITDILVNTHRRVYIERGGLLELTRVVFKDAAHLRHIIDKIVSNVGRRVDESSPMCDARLDDGSRVNVVIPPLALDGPLMSIRRFGRSPIGIEQLLAKRAITSPMLELLKNAVKARLNIVVSGGTGAGKTTLLNGLSSFISEGERIVKIEDSAELLLQQHHVARMECRPPNVEGKGAVRQRELVINALRMRPDRIAGRGARWRSPRHAAGHEHRTRRLADDYSRQQSAGRDRTSRDHVLDGRHQSAGQGHSTSNRIGSVHRRAGRPAPAMALVE
jgi:pilus assembly protein CpaF